MRTSAPVGASAEKLPTAVPKPWSEILLVEDNAARAQRRRIAGVAPATGRSQIVVRLHRIVAGGCEVLAERTYRAGSLKRNAKDGGRAIVALELIYGVAPRKGLVVAAGPVYGCNALFLEALAARGLDYIVEVRPSTLLLPSKCRGEQAPEPAAALLRGCKWELFELEVPHATARIAYRAAFLADVRLPDDRTATLFAAQTGGILGLHRGTVFGLASASGAGLAALLRVVGWARWIRPAARRQERKGNSSKHIKQGESLKGSERRVNGITLVVRANITLACRQDEQKTVRQRLLPQETLALRGVLASTSRVLNVAELFAGAGGMGLGFLLAGDGKPRFRLVFSGEVNPVYVATLRNNHHTFKVKHGGELGEYVPESLEPLDLRSAESLSLLRRAARAAGDLHLLIGGPPCQGFSNANRNSWHSANPHNRLMDVFLSYVEALRPRAFLMENVQGILWTPKGGRSPGPLTVVEHLARRMVSAGYEVFPKLLDAVWYGVPQYRSRFFLLGLRRDLGYREEHFGEWGPFPFPSHGGEPLRPYVTVREAIGDLPRVGNGQDASERKYREPSAKEIGSNDFLRLMRKGAPAEVISDHVTSRHAEYVIDRYRRIPEGGNWRDIADALTNYSDVERTHSNIYRRLNWDEPSITIGHYRKSMLVHPSQHRGLSLREASRLQSLPDWFRFAGASDGQGGGLMHKQQQLANAVSPLVTKALAEFILKL